MERQNITAIEKLRKSLGYNQREFAKKISIKQGSLSDIERGRIGLSSKIKERASEIFNLPLDWYKQDALKLSDIETEKVKDWQYCPHCGKPLK